MFINLSIQESRILGVPIMCFHFFFLCSSFLLFITFVPKYRSILPKLRRLRKLTVVLNLYIIFIVFTILSLRERDDLCFQHSIYC